MPCHQTMSFVVDFLYWCAVLAWLIGNLKMGRNTNHRKRRKKKNRRPHPTWVFFQLRLLFQSNVAFAPWGYHDCFEYSMALLTLPYRRRDEASVHVVLGCWSLLCWWRLSLDCCNLERSWFGLYIVIVCWGYCGKRWVCGGVNEFYELIGRFFVFFICDPKHKIWSPHKTRENKTDETTTALFDFVRKSTQSDNEERLGVLPKQETLKVSILTLWAKYDMTL
jgi:hypothetical protein